MHFKGKVAIVTGGSSGIGKETAKRLVTHGASVVLSGRDEAKLHCAAKEVSSDPSMVQGLCWRYRKTINRNGPCRLGRERVRRPGRSSQQCRGRRPKPFLELTEQEYDSFYGHHS